MRHLRSIRVRSYVLPLLLGALALRFLIPTDFMPAPGEGVTISVAMCSSSGNSEQLEIPDEPAKPFCEHCLTPPLGAPLAPLSFASYPPLPDLLVLPSQESEIPEVALVRAQSPRAPPNA